MFRSASFKLTIWYLIIVMAISIFFSIVVYAVGSDGIANGIRLQSERIYNEFPIFESNPILKPSKDIERGDHILLMRLLFFNSIVFIFAGAASYFLAIKTLGPIEETHEQQKRFTSDVSHELRTPLTAIRMESEVALMNSNLTKDELKATLASNLEETTKIENLINSLLRLSRLESEEIKKNFSPIYVKEIVKDALSNINKQAKYKNIKIINKVKVNDQILGDKNSLIQLLTIFLDNAIKYSPANKEISLVFESNKNFKNLIIKDQGIGINKKDLDHIFDRFYKSDISRARTNDSKESYGIGLSIAKSIAEVHDINIIVTSQLNKGTTIKLVF